MASVVNWQQPVDRFLEQVNWLGLAVAIPTPVETQDWLNLSVRQFWQDCNWDGTRVVRQMAWGVPRVSPVVADRPWLAWSVDEFMASVNWTGQALSDPELPLTAAASVNKVIPGSWLQLNLRDFFERVNWLGRPEQVQLLPGMCSPLQLSVTQFCQAVAWDAKPMIAAVKAPPPPPEPEAEPAITFDSFSNLF